MSLKNKFTIIEIALFVLGIILGIIAQDFAFGFVLAFLLPGIAYCIERITLERKFRKDKDRFSERKVVERQLPTNFYGRILNTDSQSKKQRVQWYMIEAALFASLFRLFDIVGIVFGTGTGLALDIEIFEYRMINTICSHILSFLCMFVIVFVIDYYLYEYAVKKYRRIGKD